MKEVHLFVLRFFVSDLLSGKRDRKQITSKRLFLFFSPDVCHEESGERRKTFTGNFLSNSTSSFFNHHLVMLLTFSIFVIIELYASDYYFSFFVLFSFHPLSLFLPLIVSALFYPLNTHFTLK